MFRSWVLYLLTILIALQSVLAIADEHKTHPQKNLHKEQKTYTAQRVENSVVDEFAPYHSLINTATENHTFSDKFHVDCHHNHCHHASVVFFSENNLQKLLFFQQDNLALQVPLINSPLLSPDLRPPII